MKSCVILGSYFRFEFEIIYRLVDSADRPVFNLSGRNDLTDGKDLPVYVFNGAT